jgi:hypothetical protein
MDFCIVNKKRHFKRILLLIDTLIIKLPDHTGTKYLSDALQTNKVTVFTDLVFLLTQMIPMMKLSNNHIGAQYLANSLQNNTVIYLIDSF